MASGQPNAVGYSMKLVFGTILETRFPVVKTTARKCPITRELTEFVCVICERIFTGFCFSLGL